MTDPELYAVSVILKNGFSWIQGFINLDEAKICYDDETVNIKTKRLTKGSQILEVENYV